MGGYAECGTDCAVYIDAQLSYSLTAGGVSAISFPKSSKFLAFQMDPTPAAGTLVSCIATIDNVVSSFKYNGETLTSSGSYSNWGAAKSFSFIDAGAGVYLEIEGYEASNCDGCACSGLGVECTADDTTNAWHHFSSDTSHWVASGASSAAGLTDDFGSVCTSSSGFSLSGGSYYTKIWADVSGGTTADKYARFRGSPYDTSDSSPVATAPSFAFAVKNDLQKYLESSETAAASWKCIQSSSVPAADDSGNMWYSSEYDHSAWGSGSVFDPNDYEDMEAVNDVVLGVKGMGPEWVGAAGGSSVGTGETVTCTMTIDNAVTAIKYNNVALSTSSGTWNSWTSKKTFSFQDAGVDAVLE